MILNIKKLLQINFTFSFYFLNVATRKFQTTSVPCIICVHQLCAGTCGLSSHVVLLPHSTEGKEHREMVTSGVTKSAAGVEVPALLTGLDCDEATGECA